MVFVVINRVKRRLIRAAAFHAMRAALKEPAAILRNTPPVFVDIFGAAPAFIGVRHRNRIDEQLYIRMLWLFDDASRLAAFGYASLIQNMNVVADLIGCAQVMGDVEERDINFVA